MIVGVNRVFPHGGQGLPHPGEDLGEGHAAFEVRVYDHGAVLWRKKVGYGDVLVKGLSHLEQDEELRSLMEKTLHTVQAAIAKGKLT